MNRKVKEEFEENEELYTELAERRTIKMLGMTSSQVDIAKAYETTKIVELNNIKEEFIRNRKKKSSFWAIFGSEPF